LRAAKRVVVPLRTESRVMVPRRLFLIGKPGWVRSSYRGGWVNARR
jgi:hypothetical protein